MIFAIKLEKYMAGAGILGVIINKLCHKKKLCPIILLKVNKSLEVSFYCIILSFDLIVHLWVEGGGESLLDAKEIT